MLGGNEVAKWFIYNNPELASGYIDENTKINKLLYFSNLMYFCISGENMISDDFIAFPNGPVVFSVYRDYRYNGLNQLPQQAPALDANYCKVLNIISFVYSDRSTKELVDESHSHSLWKNVSSLIPHNPKIEFQNIEQEVTDYYKALYQTYAAVDFSTLTKEKINDNIYYYLKDSFTMDDAIVEKLSTFGKFDEPKFLEMVSGELVVS